MDFKSFTYFLFLIYPSSTNFTIGHKNEAFNTLKLRFSAVSIQQYSSVGSKYKFPYSSFPASTGNAWFRILGIESSSFWSKQSTGGIKSTDQYKPLHNEYFYLSSCHRILVKLVYVGYTIQVLSSLSDRIVRKECVFYFGCTWKWILLTSILTFFDVLVLKLVSGCFNLLGESHTFFLWVVLWWWTFWWLQVLYFLSLTESPILVVYKFRSVVFDHFLELVYILSQWQTAINFQFIQIRVLFVQPICISGWR